MGAGSNSQTIIHFHNLRLIAESVRAKLRHMYFLWLAKSPALADVKAFSVKANHSTESMQNPSCDVTPPLACIPITKPEGAENNKTTATYNRPVNL